VSRFKLAISVAVLAAAFSSPGARSQTQNCVVSGGTNFGVIIQNCAPVPQITPVKPAPGQPIIPIDGPNGTFLYQVFAKVVGPIDVRVIACGDDVSDVTGGPWPAGMVSITDLSGGPPNCKAKQLDRVSTGTWLFEAITKSKEKPVQIQAILGEFTQPP
jgi:hypothetical protein